ncbi:MAG: hypothetical protein V7K60_01325 [Nostoc sp.]
MVIVGIRHWAQKPEVQRGKGEELTATFSPAPPVTERSRWRSLS